MALTSIEHAPRVVLVTGASGMLGSALVAHMSRKRHFIPVAASRKPIGSTPGIGSVRTRYVPDVRDNTDWREALSGCDAVVHCAARAHVLKEDSKDAAAAFREVNVEGTLSLARQAIDRGVPHFVFVSSAGVHGVTNASPVRESDDVSPTEDYAKSKLEAERRLVDLASGSGMAITIVRPPLIYGPRVSGNMLRLLKLAFSGLPLPFGAVDNRRSFVGVTNLCDAMLTCLENQAAGGRTYLVSDQSDMSTREFIQAIASAGAKRIWLPSVPIELLRRLSSLARRGDTLNRLIGTNLVDSSAISKELGWSPQKGVEYDMIRMVHWFRANGAT